MTAPMVSVPAHYAENVLSAARLLEQWPNPIDQREGAALRKLGELMLAAAPAPQPVQGEAVAFSTAGPDGENSQYGHWYPMTHYEAFQKFATLRDGHRYVFAYTQPPAPAVGDGHKHDFVHNIATDVVTCLHCDYRSPAVQIAAPGEGDMARALEDLRQSSIPSRSYDLIAEAIAAYDPERMAKCGNTVAAPGDVERGGEERARKLYEPDDYADAFKGRAEPGDPAPPPSTPAQHYLESVNGCASQEWQDGFNVAALRSQGQADAVVTLERWGFPNGISSPAARCDDGYWTPWHIAQAALAQQANKEQS